MTQDEIIEMATQVSERNYGRIIFFEFEVEELEAFAKLVAAKAVAELESQEPMATIAVRWHEPVGKVAYVLEVNLPVGVHKLYTHPPQRTWVGLTDEEVNEIYISVEEKVNEHWENGGTTMMFPLTLYKAIEQALKEKNNA
jgi:hypothetical protein